MTALAGFNIADLTDLVATRYIEAANQAFWESVKLGICVSTDPNHDRKLVGAQSFTLTQLAGLAGAVTSSTAANATALTETTPTDSQVSVAWAFYQKHVKIDAVSEAGSFMDLAMAAFADLIACASQTYDYLAGTELVASATAGTYCQVGQTAKASITADNIMTLAYARRAFAALTKAKAPQFLIPGVGLTYLAIVHPDVAYDLKSEASGIFTGAQNVNAGNYIGNVLGQAAGFLWIESNAAPLLEANAGAGSTVDVYKTMFVADRSLGRARADVPDNSPVCEDIPLVLDQVGAADRSIIGRLAKSGEYLGFRKLFGMAMNMGFALVNPTGTYRVESASSLGANT